MKAKNKPTPALPHKTCARFVQNFAKCALPQLHAKSCTRSLANTSARPQSRRKQRFKQLVKFHVIPIRLSRVDTRVCLVRRFLSNWRPMLRLGMAEHQVSEGDPRIQLASLIVMMLSAPTVRARAVSSVQLLRAKKLS